MELCPKNGPYAPGNNKMTLLGTKGWIGLNLAEEEFTERVDGKDLSP